MRWTFTVLDKPDYEAVMPLAELKTAIDVTDNDHDALITSHRDAAVEWVQDYTNRFLAPTQLRFISDGLGRIGFTLPFAPVQSVEAMRVAGNVYGGFRSVAGEPHTLLPASGQSWPSYTQEPGAIEVDYTVGYEDRAAIPANLLQGVQIAAGLLYERDMTEASWQYLRDFLFPIRYGGFA